jgi:hypothetical protein
MFSDTPQTLFKTRHTPVILRAIVINTSEAHTDLVVSLFVVQDLGSISLQFVQQPVSIHMSIQYIIIDLHILSIIC